MAPLGFTRMSSRQPCTCAKNWPMYHVEDYTGEKLRFVDKSLHSKLVCTEIYIASVNFVKTPLLQDRFLHENVILQSHV